MQRRVLSPAGQRRQRIGRKIIASSRVSASMERSIDRTTTASSRASKWHVPTISYSFRRWHAISVAVVFAVGLSVTVFLNFQHQQAIAAEKIRIATAEKAAVQKEKKQQACLADVTAKKQSQVGKATYDELYDGLCG